MEKRPPLPMTQLDMLVGSEELQMMKLMLSYIPSAYRGMLAIYIKFTEFQNTLKLFGGFGYKPGSEIIKSKDIHSPSDILEDLRPFMSPGDMESLDMLINAMNMMDMMKGMDMSDLSGFGGTGEMSDMMNMFNNIVKGNQDDE
ncbi:MAG: hypothetical protein Q4C52_01460 [Eubacteriales bacterium]|nr:hypothetical protein [Eubacteriales bacterium]